MFGLGVDVGDFVEVGGVFLVIMKARGGLLSCRRQRRRCVDWGIEWSRVRVVRVHVEGESVSVGYVDFGSNLFLFGGVVW